MTLIGELAVNAVVITEGLERGGEHFRREMGAMAEHTHMTSAALVGLAATAAFTAYELVHGQEEIAVALDKTSRKIGTTVESLSAMRFAASQTAHIANEQFDSAMTMMQIQLAKAADGGGKAVKTLERMGLSAESLSHMTADQKLGALAVGFERVHDPARRLAMAVDIFGKKNSDMVLLLEKGAAGLGEFTGKAYEAGAVLDALANEKLEETHKASDRLGRSWGALKHQVAGALAPAFTGFFSEIAETIALMRGQNPYLDAYNEKIRREKEAVDAATAAHRKYNEERFKKAGSAANTADLSYRKAEFEKLQRDKEALQHRIDSTREGNETFGMSDVDAARHHLSHEMISKDLEQQLIKQLEVREKLTKQHELDVAAQEKENQLNERAKSIHEQNKTALEKFKDQLAEIRELQQKGKLTDDDAARAVKGARAGFTPDAAGAAARHPALAAIKFGTAEAYKAIHESRAAGEMKKVNEKQLKELEEANKLAAQTNRILEAKKDVVIAAW